MSHPYPCPCAACWKERQASVYPVRCYRSDDEPKAGDVVRMRHDDETHRGVSPSFSDCVVIHIDRAISDHAVELGRPHVYLRSDGEVETRVERFRVSIARLVEHFWLLTEGKTGKAENRLRPVDPHFTVLVPWSDTPTKWHPTEKTGPFAELVRGSFKTIEAAAAWAISHLEGQPYSIRYEDPMADPELRAEFEKHTGYPLDLQMRAREAHSSTVNVDELLLNAPSCTLVKKGGSR